MKLILVTIVLLSAIYLFTSNFKSELSVGNFPYMSLNKTRDSLAIAKVMNGKPDSKYANSIVLDKTLKQTYQNYFPIGAAISPSLLTDSTKAKFVVSQYSSITPINEMKAKYIQPQEGVFVWDGADKIVDFAVSNNLKIRGHCLVWFQKMPDWFYIDGNDHATKEKILTRIDQHIKKVVSRYKGKVYCWDVVNEAYSFFGNNPIEANKNKLYNFTAADYFEKAFQSAHEADPNAKLFYNDDRFEDEKKRNRVFQYLKKMKEKGVPIDGIGIQGHWGIEGIDEAYLQETIDMFASIGLEVQITELDISIYPKNVNGKAITSIDLVNINDKFTNQVETAQATTYEKIFKVCRNNRKIVTGVTFWAPYDKDNYLTDALKKKNYPYLFREDLSPKLSYLKVVTF